MDLRQGAQLAGFVLAAWLGAAAAQEAPPAAAASGAKAAAGEPAVTPEAAVRRLQDGLVAMAEQHGDDSFDVRYRALAPVVDATHDLPYIAELTIRREWADLSADERQRFVAAFTRLSVATYASRFRNLEPGMFEIAGEKPGARGRAQVNATLTTPEGDTIPFEYVLHESDGGYRIVNILARGVSDLALKRAEYRQLLDDGGIDDLIAELEQQAAAAAAE